jgi:hypothetical protein
MKHFSRARGRLAHLPFAARAVYSIFLAFTLVGLAMSAWLTHEMVGLGLSRLDAYYAGAPDLAAPTGSDGPAAGARSGASDLAALTGSGGPALDVPPELELAPATEAMPLRKLLEVTHFHLFSMPLYLLVLSHLFMLSALAERTKVVWIAAATFAVAGHIAAPWLVRAGAAGSAFAYGTTGALVALSFAVMAGVALFEMWAPGAPTGAPTAPEP